MSAGKQIFRPEALERLASPEQLDELMVITDSKAWISLAAIGLTIATAVLWSIFGSVPSSIQGSGILLREGGIFDVPAGANGQIASLFAAEDSTVEEGQILGYIAQPFLATEISIDNHALQILRARLDRIVEEGRRDLAIQLEVLSQDSLRLDHNIALFKETVDVLEQRLENTRAAQEAGLVTRQAVEDVEQQLTETRSRAAQERIALSQIPSRRIRTQAEHDAAVDDIETQVLREVQDSILKAEQLTESNEIRSPYRGRITQLMVDVGQIVNPHTPVVSLELSDTELQAVVMVSVEGPRIVPGSTVHVQPLTVNWEQYGFLEGTVAFVSQTPVSLARLNRILKNESLARELSQGSDPYVVEVDLREADTPSGYRWTSGQGPPASFNIRAGVLASAKIIVESRRPITLVIPALRGLFGF